MKIQKWCKQHTGQIVVFLVAFLPRLFLALQAYPVRTLSDEVATMSSAAYFAGKDWSHIVREADYYGFGFSILFAPLYRLTDDPFVLYRTMLAGACLCQAVSAPLCYHLLETCFQIREKWYLLAASIACSYMVVTRAMIVYNEHGLILTAWLVAAILLKLLSADRKGQNQGKIKYTVLLMAVLFYMLTLHTRTLLYWAVLPAAALVYLLVEKRSLIAWKVALPMGIVGYPLTKALIRALQEKLWVLDKGQPLKNATVGLKLSWDFLKPDGRGPWLNIILGQINTAGVLSGGLLLFGMAVGISLTIRLARRKAGEERDGFWAYYLILLVFGLLILGTIAAQSLMWLTLLKKAMAQGVGSALYGMKAVTYVRYMGPYLGPVLMVVFAYAYKRQQEMAKAAVFGTALTWGFLLVWAKRIYPYLYRNTYALECYLPMAFQNIRALDMDKNIYVPASLLGAALALVFCVCYRWKKPMLPAVLIGCYLLYQYCFNAVAYDLIDQKGYFATIDRSYAVMRQMCAQAPFEISEVYVVDTRQIKDHQSYFLYQYCLGELRVVPGAPQADCAQALLLTNGAQTAVSAQDGYRLAVLDEGEYLWVKGERLQDLAEKCGVVWQER